MERERLVVELRNCAGCDRPFLYTGNNLCPNCLKEEQKQFEKVYHYLRDNPNASIAQLCDDTGVDEKLILKFLRQGRLQLAKASYYLQCEICGRSISTGRICPECANQMKRNLAFSESKNEKQKSDEKRFWYSEHLHKAPERRRGARRERP